LIDSNQFSWQPIPLREDCCGGLHVRDVAQEQSTRCPHIAHQGNIESKVQRFSRRIRIGRAHDGRHGAPSGRAESSVVMTTVILRRMLNRGIELAKELKCIIYDEVHLMRDAELGVVGEESIIFLPDSVRFVFISATIPNASQFADWRARLHHQPRHVVYSTYSHVSLQSYIFSSGVTGVHLVVDEKGKFRVRQVPTSHGTTRKFLGRRRNGRMILFGTKEVTSQRQDSLPLPTSSCNEI